MELIIQTLDLKLPYTEVTILLDALRRYSGYIDHLNPECVDEDIYADLQNDNETVKALEKSLTDIFEQHVGQY